MLSDKSIKNIRATLRRILASAVEWELIDRIPNLPKVKVTDKVWDFFSREEVTKLVAATRDAEERALLSFPLDTGARAGQQLALEWGDIDAQQPGRLPALLDARAGRTDEVRDHPARHSLFTVTFLPYAARRQRRDTLRARPCMKARRRTLRFRAKPKHSRQRARQARLKRLCSTRRMGAGRAQKTEQSLLVPNSYLGQLERR